MILTKLKRYTAVLYVLILSDIAASAPAEFPTSGKGLWYTSPGTDWTSDFLPIGNGFLAGRYVNFVNLCLSPRLDVQAMIPGGTGQEVTQLNIESLWSGGPFQYAASFLQHSNPSKLF